LGRRSREPANQWCLVAECGNRDACGARRSEALSDVRAPVLVIHANGPWDDAPYLDEQTVRKQLAAARTAKLFVAEGSHHADVIRRPDDSS
jgi:hypothetical protein